jgi:hypothetical protein
VITDHLSRLFVNFFDDASMYAPRCARPKEALLGHVRYQMAWYGEMVGLLQCSDARLSRVHEHARKYRAGTVDVSVVVPRGLDAVPDVAARARSSSSVRVRAIEVPVHRDLLSRALSVLDPFIREQCHVYVEIAPADLTAHHAHRLAPTGVRVKLRTGGTSLDEFQNESTLARALVLCASERLAFKCASGLQKAVRHRDSNTFAEQHGYLNVALAARVAAASGSVQATEQVLAERDPRAIEYRVSDLSASDVTAIRALFACAATTDVTESVTDLVELRLTRAP